MKTTDDDVFTRAQSAYERSRLTLGLGAAAVVALIPIISMALAGHQPSGLIFGALLTGSAGTLFWRGGVAALSAMSGLKAGLVPFVLAHAANLYGHVCVPGRGCSTLCVPACAAGGLVAGFVVERLARSSSRPNIVRAGGAGVAFLTGALSCSCVGSLGIIGLLAGMTFTLVASRLVRART